MLKDQLTKLQVNKKSKQKELSKKRRFNIAVFIHRSETPRRLAKNDT
jgi:hypothetical protein